MRILFRSGILAAVKMPKTVRAGSSEITVREFADGRYGFDYHNEGGQRVKCRWKSPEKAVEEARDRVRAIAGGKVELLDVSRDDWALFCSWKDAGLTAEKLKDFLTWDAARTKSRLVREVEAELMEIKNADAGLDSSWVTNLKNTIKLFSADFGHREIVEIDASEIEDWLRRLDKQPRTRNNIHAIVVSLFRFAREREYLPWGEKTAAERVSKLKIRATANDIEIYTPKEFRALLEALSADFKLWAILGAFAGIRTEEIRPKAASSKDPLRWEDFQWAEKQIFVRPETAKTGRQRYVPISDNLAAWLELYKGRQGLVIPRPASALYEETKALPARKVTYKKNALRHSYGSYRNAIIRNINQLAEEMGNSPAIARRNYEKPQPRSVAEKWFGIMPPGRAG